MTKFSEVLKNASYNIEKPEENIVNLEKVINHNDFKDLELNDQFSFYIRYAHECYATRKFETCWKYYKYKLFSKIKVEKYPESIKINKGKIALLENLSQINPNKSLLVWDDGGYGDIFLHSRFLNLFQKNINYKIKLRKNLNWIYKDNLKKHIIEDDTKEKFNYHVSFMMLEPLFNFEPKKFKLNFNYFISPENKNWEKYFQRYKNNTKIGLVLNTQTTRARNIKFNIIRDLIDKKPGIQFFLIDKSPCKESLEYEKRSSNLSILSNIDSELPFFDTYSILNYLDVLISVDTAISHLAGYLGLNTYLILHKPNHYYWGLTSKKSIYYNNHTILRQQESGNWKNVVEELIDEFEY